MPYLKGWPLKLYLLAVKESLGCLLAQNNAKGHEQTVYYLSRVVTLRPERVYDTCNRWVAYVHQGLP